ncbi:MAG: hypothetical protein CVT99_02290 [Bacteroidetes bacterium HGW-Bacteroidetes-16]|jgi:uncharacterized protein (TIGR02145 family)|nr:MAG: hypothetical protein CVT99_02290 [Bacteroidetes bacterium HGW-Bacteroidetes-16]
MKTKTTLATLITMLIVTALTFQSCKKDPNSPNVTFTDSRDGQTYNTVVIGDQTWMAENLNFDLPGQSYTYDDTSATSDIYGRLYDHSAAVYACPSGWHLPSDDEWKTLEMALGMSQSDADRIAYRGTDEGGKMKEMGTSTWAAPNTGATNSSGFNALPAGVRYANTYMGLGKHTTWWLSTDADYYIENYYYSRHLSYDKAQIYRHYANGSDGYSVRCIKD